MNRSIIILILIFAFVLVIVGAAALILYFLHPGGFDNSVGSLPARSYMWFEISPQNASKYGLDKSVYYGYMDQDCTVRYRGSVIGKQDVDLGNYSACFPYAFPSIALDPDEYISMAKAKVSGMDPSAEFRRFDYLPPKLTSLYFQKEKPYAEVYLVSTNRGYAVFYDLADKKEAAFFQEDLGKYPICRIAVDEIGNGNCTNLRFLSGSIIYGPEPYYIWKQALNWMNENTSKDSSFLTWWDYYGLIRVHGERRAIPDPRDTVQLNKAATFYTEATEEEAAYIAKDLGIRYVVADYDLIGKSGGLKYVSSFNDSSGQGSYTGYAQCHFSPDPKLSTVNPQPVKNDKGGFDMVSQLYFECNDGMGLIFGVRNGQYSANDVYVFYQWQKYPWASWQNSTGASILGVQSLRDILGNALNYPEKYINFPTFTTFIYVPDDPRFGGGDYNKVMFTKLYLGDHLEEYQEAGLANKSIQPSKYFKLVPGFEGDKADYSYYGYVKVYETVDISS